MLVLILSWIATILVVLLYLIIVSAPILFLAYVYYLCNLASKEGWIGSSTARRM